MPTCIKIHNYRLTDAFNNARDRVRYLEVLSPHLEALEAHPSLPSLLATVLPALTSSVRHMEGLSRAYARSGYLGILFTKVREGEGGREDRREEGREVKREKMRGDRGVVRCAIGTEVKPKE